MCVEHTKRMITRHKICLCVCVCVCVLEYRIFIEHRNIGDIYIYISYICALYIQSDYKK